MLTRSRIVSSASALAGEPADEPLPRGVPESLRFETAADIETELLRDLNNSTENRAMAKVPVRLQPQNREFTLPQSGLEDAAYISLSFDESPNVTPIPVNITTASMVDAEARDGRRSIGFYGDKPQTGITSWLPSGTETLTIWYDKSPATDPSADQSTFTIAQSYVPLLKLLLAAQMLEWMGKPLGAMLMGRISRGLEQWKDYVTNGKQQGIVEKHAWRPGRYNSGGSQWDAWPGRVPFE